MTLYTALSKQILIASSAGCLFTTTVAIDETVYAACFTCYTASVSRTSVQSFIETICVQVIMDEMLG